MQSYSFPVSVSAGGYQKLAFTAREKINSYLPVLDVSVHGLYIGIHFLFPTDLQAWISNSGNTLYSPILSIFGPSDGWWKAVPDIEAGNLIGLNFYNSSGADLTGTVTLWTSVSPAIIPIEPLGLDLTFSDLSVSIPTGTNTVLLNGIYPDSPLLNEMIEIVSIDIDDASLVTLNWVAGSNDASNFSRFATSGHLTFAPPVRIPMAAGTVGGIYGNFTNSGTAAVSIHSRVWYRFVLPVGAAGDL
jgi:hypothetical protein